MAFRTESKLRTRLSPAHERLVLSLFPEGTIIEDARYFDNYDLPCPIRVRVRLPDGRPKRVVLRTSRRGDMRMEAEVLRTLHRLGHPVPEILAEGQPGPDGALVEMVLSLLPGVSLQALAMASPPGLEEAQGLLIEAVARLSGLTALIEAEPVARLLPRASLTVLLENVAASGSPWLAEPEFHSAITRLRPILAKITTRLVFSNGDYQPANFLAQDGHVTGFLDFESACFTDPLFGFAKYPIYDLHPMNKAGFIDRLLEAKGWTREEFAPRLALDCLETLRREIPVSGNAVYRNHVTALLRESLEILP